MAVLHFLQVEWNKKIKLSLLMLFTSFGFSDLISIDRIDGILELEIVEWGQYIQVTELYFFP